MGDGIEGISIISVKARDDGLTSPADLPYFEGDFWPNVIEDCIREASSEEAQRKKEENEDDGEDEDLFTVSIYITT